MVVANGARGSLNVETNDSNTMRLRERKTGCGAPLGDITNVASTVEPVVNKPMTRMRVSR